VPDDDDVVCPKCGAEVSATDVECPKCHEPLVGA
jgi:hypothetical protein